MLLYKYCDIDSATKIIESKTIKLSNPSTFNDPFDSVFKIEDNNREKALDEVKRYEIISNLFKKVDNPKIVIKSNEKAIINVQKNKLLFAFRRGNFSYTEPINALMKLEIAKKMMKICNKQNLSPIFDNKIVEPLKTMWGQSLISCFSQRNDSILMWSHYGDSHKGACLEFEKPNDAAFQKVIYNEERVFIDLFNAMSVILGYMYLGEKADVNNPVLSKAVLAPFYSKSKEWSYEEEVRCVYSSTNLESSKIEKIGDSFYLPSPKLVSVYLGCKSEGLDTDKLIQTAADNNVSVTHMKESESKYLIVPDLSKRISF